MRRHAQRLAQHTVDTHAHDEAGLIRLDMDVGHAVARGIGDDAVDQADGGRIVGSVEQVVGGGQMIGEQVEFIAEAERAGGHSGGLAVHRVSLGQQPVERLGRDETDIERPREMAAQFEQHLGIAALAHRDGELADIIRIEHHTETPRKGIGNRRGRRRPEPGGAVTDIDERVAHHW